MANSVQLAFAFAFFLALSFTSIPSVNAQEEIECRGRDLNMTAAQKTIITDCLKEAGIGSIWKMPMDKIACFGVCILERKKLLTPDGKLDHEKILDYIYHVMQPEEVKKPLVDGTDKCMKEHGEKVRADGDPNCQTFMEAGQCVHDVFLEICVIG